MRDVRCLQLELLGLLSIVEKVELNSFLSLSVSRFGGVFFLFFFLVFLVGPGFFLGLFRCGLILSVP